MIPGAKRITNILLIDDDVDDCMFLNHALNAISANIKLNYIQEVDQVIMAIYTSQPSLIFIDYHMPKRNGLELLRLIKSYPAFINIPIVLWSTSSIHCNLIAFCKEEVQSFIQKPCSYSELVSTIKGILRFNKIGLPHFSDSDIKSSRIKEIKVH